MMNKQARNKTLAVVLAVLVGIFSWIYTWKYDYWKFWVALVAWICLFWTIIVPLGLFVWVIIDACLKPKEWYENY